MSTIPATSAERDAQDDEVVLAQIRGGNRRAIDLGHALMALAEAAPKGDEALDLWRYLGRGTRSTRARTKSEIESEIYGDACAMWDCGIIWAWVWVEAVWCQERRLAATLHLREAARFYNAAQFLADTAAYGPTERGKLLRAWDAMERCVWHLERRADLIR